MSVYGKYHSPRGYEGQKVAAGATSAQSSAIDASFVDIIADADVWIAIGVDPTAAADTSYPLIAEYPVRIRWRSGDKLAVLQKSTAGNIWIHPVG